LREYFVLTVEDNLEAIFSTIKNAALIHPCGGGKASEKFDLSYL
jgi:glutamate dehydrogenase/leucine dehydrogenase